MMMDWTKLLLNERYHRPDYSSEPHRPYYTQDADRITFSTPFRRLANKTQVHPLNEHDHIHHRLIHSIETASVGRSLGIAVGHWLEERKEVPEGERHSIAGTVLAACLAHDIGNPPFGHAGESAIGDWFTRKFVVNETIFENIPKGKRVEFEKFEGNAQGFRLIANIEMYRGLGGMQLSYPVLSAFTKYPTTAHVWATNNFDYVGFGKFGIFESEIDVWQDVSNKTGLLKKTDGAWARNPLVFLVEAADDICYRIIDIEDAYSSGDLTLDFVQELMRPLVGRPNTDFETYSPEEKISYLRSKAIGKSIDACVKAFINNYPAIMSGEFSTSLIKASSVSEHFQSFKEAAQDRIFTARRKTELEVAGRNIIWTCLDGVLPIYEELARTNWSSESLPDYHRKLIRALNLDLRGVKDDYSALHSLSDFVSGMTDRYAQSVSRLVSGIR